MAEDKNIRNYNDEEENSSVINMSTQIDNTISIMSSTETNLLQSDFIKEIVNDESKYNINISSYLDTLVDDNKNVILSKENVKDDIESIENQILNSLADPSKFDYSELNNFINGRLFRFNQYDAIISKIEYARRALKVFLSEILSPDNINNKLIKPEENPLNKSENFNIISDKLMQINEYVQFEKALRDTVYYSYKYGEGYIEIKKIADKLKEAKLMESNQYNNNNKISGTDDCIGNIIIDKQSFKLYKDDINQYSNYLQESYNYSKHLTESNNGSNIDSDVSSTRDIILEYHNPKTIIPLTIDKYIIGYIKIHSSLVNATDLSSKVLQMFQLRYKSNDNKNNKLNSDIRGNKIINAIKDVIDENDLVLSRDAAHELLTITYMIDEFKRLMHKGNVTANDTTLIRFIPVNRMQLFAVNEKSKYSDALPASLFEDSLFKAKMLISTGLAIVIARINNSIDSKRIEIEVGEKSNDINNIINNTKASLFRKRFSLDTFPNLDSLSSIITNAQYYIIPKVKGQTYIDISEIRNSVSISEHVEDYKTQRDEFVAGLDVPPAFLGLEENVDARATLTQQNLQFAKRIISDQRTISECATDLFNKILRICNINSIKGKFKISFYKPNWIALEMLSEYYGKISSYRQSMIDAGVPMEIIEKRISSLFPDDQNINDIGDSLIKSIDNKIKPSVNNEGGFGDFGSDFGTTDNFGTGMDVGAVPEQF